MLMEGEEFWEEFSDSIPIVLIFTRFWNLYTKHQTYLGIFTIKAKNQISIIKLN